MDKSINILDKDYSLWIQDLSKRYHRSQIKASIKVNGEMLKFYWSLGRDIVAMKTESHWGSKFFKNLSKDLKEANQKATCFSEGNLKYMKNFYCMYQPYFEIGQQVADQFQNGKITQQYHYIPNRTRHRFCVCRQRISLKNWRKGKIHRLAFLQSQLILLHRDRSQDWCIHLCRCRSVRWLCCGLQSHSSQRRTRQSDHWLAYLQGERPHSSSICS